jgi:hypothetical protein
MPAAGEEFVRVGEPGHAFFRLRPGEQGISVFDPFAVDPPLTEQEILQSFRPGSTAVVRSKVAVDAVGLAVVSVPGAPALPRRLQDAHAEIRPGPGMTRPQFKRALGSLE